MIEETFILTNSQEVLKEKLSAFLKSTEKIFLLIGKPGVGKTTMTKIVLEHLIGLDINNGLTGPNANVIGIALSHQAKNVLGQHIPNVYTFASAYGMKEKILDNGARVFEYDKYQKDIPVGECTIPVFVHDEVSQYTQDMLDLVLEKTSMFSKIILMGDKGQLPPIDPHKDKDDKDSPVFEMNLPEECKHELTERVRQTEGNPILDLSDMIREEIFGNQDINKVLKTISSPGLNNGHGFDFIPYSGLKEHIKDKNKLNTKVIAFRNKTVQYFNYEIRNFVLDNPKNLLVNGDIICMLDNYYHLEDGNIVTYVLHNSDIFKLEKVHKRYQKFSDNHKMHKIQVYIGNIEGQKHKQLIVPTEEGQKEVDVILNDLAKKCNEGKAKWKDFWQFKKYFCSCSYGYSVTAYKAQGSTYESVYVDINDILLTKPLTPKRKLQTIYTAITRARENVYFLKGRK